MVTRLSLLAVAIAVAAAAAGQRAHALSLEEASQMALDTNPGLQVARLEAASRVHEIRLAEAGYYPEVNAVVGVGRERTRDINNNHISLNRKEAGLVAEQMLFDGYATKEEVNRQKARLRSAEQTAEYTAEDIVMQATNAYFSVLREHELYLLAKATQANHQSIFDQMKLRQQSGVGSQADLDQITGRLALANTNVETTQANLVDASTNFQAVVGVYPDVGNMQYPSGALIVPQSLEEALTRAEASNPALQSALADIDAGKAQYEASKSPFWPRLSLEAEHNMTDDVGGVDGNEESTLMALRMRYNLYRGGADSARKKQTALLLNEAMSIRDDKQRKVAESLRLAWNAIEAVDRQVPYLEEHVKASTATKKAYEQQFNIGRRTLLDLLNTENEAVDAQRSLIAARYDRAISQMQLLNAMGGLRQALALRSPAPQHSAN